MFIFEDEAFHVRGSAHIVDEESKVATRSRAAPVVGKSSK